MNLKNHGFGLDDLTGFSWFMNNPNCNIKILFGKAVSKLIITNLEIGDKN